MTEQLIALALSVLGALSIIAGAYFKGRKDKDNSNKAKELGSAVDAKQRLDEIKSSDDDEYLERVRNAER